MKVKRVLLLTLVFLASFLFSLYLTFPFDRIAKKILFEKGLRPVNVSFHHFPPELLVGELPLNGIILKKLAVKPLSFNRFMLECELCGGRLDAVFSYPVRELSFKLMEVKLSSCPLDLKQAELNGTVGGAGNLTFKEKHLTGGKGEFELSGVDLKNINFGPFSFKKLNLGDGKIKYTVGPKDYVKLRGELKGKDADLTVKGSVSYNPRKLMNSYVNLVFSLSMKSGKFAGQKFNFTVRGNVNSLRFY